MINNRRESTIIWRKVWDFSKKMRRILQRKIFLSEMIDRLSFQVCSTNFVRRRTMYQWTISSIGFSLFQSSSITKITLQTCFCRIFDWFVLVWFDICRLDLSNWCSTWSANRQRSLSMDYSTRSANWAISQWKRMRLFFSKTKPSGVGNKFHLVFS